MLKSLLVLCWVPIAWAAPAAGPNCVDGKIRVMVDGAWREEKASYCYQEGSGFLISQACASKPEACRRKYLSRKPAKASIKPIQVGSPGFKDCERVHGTPEMIDYFWNGEWAESDRCVLEQGSKWFASTGQVSNWLIAAERPAKQPAKK